MGFGPFVFSGRQQVPAASRSFPQVPPPLAGSSANVAEPCPKAQARPRLVVKPWRFGSSKVKVDHMGVRPSTQRLPSSKGK